MSPRSGTGPTPRGNLNLPCPSDRFHVSRQLRTIKCYKSNKIQNNQAKPPIERLIQIRHDDPLSQKPESYLVRVEALGHGILKHLQELRLVAALLDVRGHVLSLSHVLHHQVLIYAGSDQKTKATRLQLMIQRNDRATYISNIPGVTMLLSRAPASHGLRSTLLFSSGDYGKPRILKSNIESQHCLWPSTRVDSHALARGGQRCQKRASLLHAPSPVVARRGPCP